MASKNPVGVFDSGVGGISVLGNLSRLLPDEQFLYYGDSEHAPYGTKEPAEVLSCVRAVMNRLMAEQVKAVVIACNTATSVAAAQLRSELSLPIIGMEPALKPAAERRKQGKILVMATPVTLRLPKFRRLMDKYGENAEPVPCPGLMERVEAEDFDGATAYLRKKLAEFAPDTVDSVVLGCTHYVFLKPVLREILPEHISLIDGNEGTARQLKRVLTQKDLLNEEGPGGLCWLSGTAEEQAKMQRLYIRACGLSRE